MVEKMSVENMSKEELVELVNVIVDGVVVLKKCDKCGSIVFEGDSEVIEYDDVGVGLRVCKDCYEEWDYNDYEVLEKKMKKMGIKLEDKN